MHAIKNVVKNQKSPEVLKSRTSNPMSPGPPGPRAQAPEGSGDENGSSGELALARSP